MPYFPFKFPHRPSLLVLQKFPPLFVAFSSSGLNGYSTPSKEETDCLFVFLVLFLCCEFERPQENVKYLVLYIPWHILEMIKMSLGLLSNVLMDDLDRLVVA